MARLPVQCPSCSSPLSVARLRCTSCAIQLEGDFHLPALLRLPEDDLAFVREFVLASGSLKAMAQIRKLSYPTVRNRLDEIITRLQQSPDTGERKREILDAIASGELSVKEAVSRLKEIDA
jgi:hypothetical protein